MDELTFGEMTKVISGFNKEYIDFWVETSFLNLYPDRLKNYDDNIKSSSLDGFNQRGTLEMCVHTTLEFMALYLRLPTLLYLQKIRRC